MSKIYYGTAGWSYKDWVGSFYPKSQSAKFDWLRFYSGYFNCVEVNASYYTYIAPRTVSGWIDKVSDNAEFVFTLKLHQDFTHKRNYDRQKIKAVNDNLTQLSKAERLGGLLLQFPYSFPYTESNLNYVKELKNIFENYNCFVEVRHKSWLRKEPLEAFKKFDLVYTTIDQPQIGEALPFEPIVVNGKAYLRFHGRNKAEWIKSISNFGKKQTYEEQSARYNYLYSPSELVEIEQIVKPFMEETKELYVIFNNHPKGDAVCNSLELMSILNENSKIDIPEKTMEEYPRLKGRAKNKAKTKNPNSQELF